MWKANNIPKGIKKEKYIISQYTLKINLNKILEIKTRTNDIKNGIIIIFSGYKKRKRIIKKRINPWKMRSKKY